MRHSISIFVLFSTFLTSAFPGGVTVGNGQDKTRVGISIKNDFKTDRDLTNAAQNIVSDIQAKSFARIESLVKKGKCDENYRKVERLTVKSFLPVIDGVLSLNREFIGYLEVELKDCRLVHKMSADEPYGGRDLWDL